MSILENIFLRSSRFLSFRCARINPMRYESVGQANTQGPNEERLKSILEKTFPQASLIEVNDISGGCGAMYEISVEAHELKGKSIVKQHQMVTEALKEEIRDMHGLRIHTAVPSK